MERGAIESRRATTAHVINGSDGSGGEGGGLDVFNWFLPLAAVLPRPTGGAGFGGLGGGMFSST
jgi:hypothetical protein